MGLSMGLSWKRLVAGLLVFSLVLFIGFPGVGVTPVKAAEPSTQQQLVVGAAVVVGIVGLIVWIYKWSAKQSDKQYERGIAYLNAGEYDKAVQALSGVWTVQDAGIQLAKAKRLGAEEHYKLGMAAFEEGNYERAYAHFKRAVEYNPDQPGANVKLREVYAILRAARLERMVVLPFSGNEMNGVWGFKMGDMVEGRIVERNPEFLEVVQAGLADRAAQSVEYTLRPTELKRLGDKYQVQLVLVGDIMDVNVSTQGAYEVLENKDNNGGENNKEKDKDKDKKVEPTIRFVLTKRAKVKATFRLVNVNTQRVILSETVEETSSKSLYFEKQPENFLAIVELPEDRVLITEALQRVADHFAGKVLEYDRSKSPSEIL